MLKISLGIKKYPKGYLGKYSDVKDLYLKLKGQGKGESFVAYSERNFGYLVEAVGNKDLIDYKPADGGLFRDWLIKKGLASLGLSLAQKVSVL